MAVTLHQGHVLDVLAGLAPGQFHCVITSPPYWGLRDYRIEPQVWGDGWVGHLGLEPTPELYVAHMVEVFRVVRRVMRPDGVLWLNLGDCYATGAGEGKIPGGGGQGNRWQRDLAGDTWPPNRARIEGLKPGDLVGMPWRVVFALQQDGWWLRQEVIWHKPNPMPESVQGVRWERHRVKVRSYRSQAQGYAQAGNHRDKRHGNLEAQPSAEWQECPGCAKCAPHDGLILRRGSGRPTRAHEQVFLLTPSDRYFYDTEAVREPQTGDIRGRQPSVAEKMRGTRPGLDGASNEERMRTHHSHMEIPGGRNLRSVWTIPTAPFSGAHFATFPPALVEPCIKAGTSERGCCAACGAPWAPIVKTGKAEVSGCNTHKPELPGAHGTLGQDGQGKRYHERYLATSEILGWRPTCAHQAGVVPCRVLDPFGGSGTVGLVADRLGRDATLIDLSNEYLGMARERITADAPLLAEVQRA